MKRRPLGILLLISAALAACSTERRLYSPDDVGVLGIDVTLIVGKEFPEIRLYRAQAPDRFHNWYSAGEEDAQVTIEYDSVTAYYYSTSWPGEYRFAFVSPPPPDGSRIILPEKTYRLSVETTSGERLTATTTTPPHLSVSEWVLLDEKDFTVKQRLQTFEGAGRNVYFEPENQLFYPEGLFEARLDEGAAMPAGYQVGLYSLDPESDFVIDPEYLDEEDYEEFERTVASPPIVPTETVVRLPWLAIFFQGRYKVKVFALDRNWYDLARSVPAFGGGGGFGGNIGDNFERPIFHVEGGIGVFGSVSVDSTGFFVHPRR